MNATLVNFDIPKITEITAQAFNWVSPSPNVEGDNLYPKRFNVLDISGSSKVIAGFTKTARVAIL